MASFPTGVTIVAACDREGVPRGLTVNSFTSVSLDPPLVLVCIAHDSSSHDRLVETSGFVVNILAGGQADVAKRFAVRPSDGRFDDVRWSPAPSGHPVLEGSLAWLDCEVDQVVRAGDHSILLGRALALGSAEQPALLFHRGLFESVGE